MKTVDFSETIAASDLRFSRSRHLIKYIRYVSIEGQGLFFYLGPRLCTYKNSNPIFSETTVPIKTKFLMKAFRYKEMKI